MGLAQALSKSLDHAEADARDGLREAQDAAKRVLRCAVATAGRADALNALRGKDRSFLVITHYQRLLDYVKPDFVHVLAGGRIVRTGGAELALELACERSVPQAEDRVQPAAGTRHGNGLARCSGSELRGPS